jgi:Rieske Fe-S protein
MREEQEQASSGSGGTTRRALFVGAGAVGMAAALAACGGDDGASGSGATGGDTTPPKGTTGADDSGAAVVLGKTSDIPVGGGVIVAGQGVVVTQPSTGTFKAFSALCTHQQCPLIGVDGGTINCGCHGSRFSIEDGSVRNGPASEPLPAKQIRVEGDVITLV